MLFINATLSKNQLYKVKNQIYEVPTFIKQDDKEFFSKYSNISARHFTDVCNLLSCYHNGSILFCQYQGVMLRNNDMLFWGFFVNLLAIIRARLWLLSWLWVNFYSSNFKRNKHAVGSFWYCCFGIQNSRILKLCIKVSLAEIFNS